MNIHLVFSVFTSRPIALLATQKTSVFLVAGLHARSRANFVTHRRVYYVFKTLQDLIYNTWSLILTGFNFSERNRVILKMFFQYDTGSQDIQLTQ